MPANVPSNAHPSETNGETDRRTYLRTIIDHYLTAADTPAKERRADQALADSFYQRGVPLTDVIHAIRLCMLRRHKRDPKLGPLAPICSLAYFRPEIELLQREPHDPGYVEYICWSYYAYFIEPAEKRDSPPEERAS